MELPKLIEWSPRLTELAQRFTADRNSLTGPERRELGSLWRVELKANGLISPWDFARIRARPVDGFQAASIIASACRPPDPFLYPVPDWDFVNSSLAALGADAAVRDGWREQEARISEIRGDWLEYLKTDGGAAELPTADEWWASVKARFELAEHQLRRMVDEPLPPAGQEGMPYPLTDSQREAFFGESDE